MGSKNDQNMINKKGWLLMVWPRLIPRIQSSSHWFIPWKSHSKTKNAPENSPVHPMDSMNFYQENSSESRLFWARHATIQAQAQAMTKRPCSWMKRFPGCKSPCRKPSCNAIFAWTAERRLSRWVFLMMMTLVNKHRTITIIGLG